MQQIQTPTSPATTQTRTHDTTNVTAQAQTPPPLPLPGSTGGPEIVPGQDPQQRSTESTTTQHGGCGVALGSPLRTYLVFMAFFTVLWAVGGGGHFWPMWPMVGWGMGLVISGQVPVGAPRRRAS